MDFFDPSAQSVIGILGDVGGVFGDFGEAIFVVVLVEIAVFVGCQVPGSVVGDAIAINGGIFIDIIMNVHVVGILSGIDCQAITQIVVGKYFVCGIYSIVALG